MKPSYEREFHLTLRVRHIDSSTGFYAWLLDVEPKHRGVHHSVIVDPNSGTNLVLVASGATDEGSTNIHHLGLGYPSKEELLRVYRAAVERGFDGIEAPQTTYGGTPLHQFWMRDPDGHRIEIYARLTADELSNKPADGQAVSLI